MRRIERQQDDDRNLAESILTWVSYTYRSLNVEELQHALAIEPGYYDLDEDDFLDDEDFTALCAGLIVIEPITKIVRLAHYSAQEYFSRVRETRFPNAQHFIAESCLTYLSLEGIKRESYDYFKTRRGLPLALYDYTQKFWADHLRGKPEETLKDQALRFLRTNASMSREWWDFTEPYPLHEAIYRNLSVLSKELIAERQYDINMRLYGILDFTVLDLACLQGHIGLADLLLRNGANPDLTSRAGETPLYYAAGRGHCAIVQRLVRYGSSLDTRNEDGDTALSRAIKAGHLNVIRILINGGADIKPSTTMSTLPCT